MAGPVGHETGGRSEELGTAYELKRPSRTHGPDKTDNFINACTQKRIINK